MAKKTIHFDVVREIALALSDVEETTIHGAPCFKLRGKLLNLPGSRQIGRTQHPCRSNRFRSARGVAGGGPERLLRDGPSYELPDGARAVTPDRSKLNKGFIGYGLALRQFADEKTSPQRSQSGLATTW
jgi:hypothetical protein